MCATGREKESKKDKKTWAQIVNVRGKGGDEFHLTQDSLPCICHSADGGLVANGKEHKHLSPPLSFSCYQSVAAVSPPLSL